MTAHRLLSRKAAADYLDKDPSFITYLAETNEIQRVELTPGGHAKYDVHDLDEYIERRKSA